MINDALYNKKDSLDLEFVQVRYTDLLGKFLAKYVQCEKENIQDIFRSGIGLDGSSVKGFANIDESDMLLLPDRETLKRIPISEYDIYTVIADVYNGFDKGRSLKDPRNVSQILENHLALNQISCQIGAEVECFIFDQIRFDVANHDNNNNDVNLITNNHNDNDDDNRLVKDVTIISSEQYGVGKYPIRPKDGYDVPCISRFTNRV